MDATAIAERILELNENDDFEGILSLAVKPGDPVITRVSEPAVMRKAYLKLSLLIHPDKLSNSFPDATRAFQALVRAFESMSAPSIESLEEAEETTSKGRGSKNTKKSAASTTLRISRSNENCYRTRVRCPRCREPWNEGTLDGNPDYFFNFLMMGLKQYMCSTCLCEFGCVSAIHQCPFCDHRFEYHPSNYHAQITCRHPKCGKSFGFYLFHISDRAMKEMKIQVKAELEAKQKQKEAKQRRAMRSAARGELTMKEKEASFLHGLADICPRCGEDFSVQPDEEIIREHLMNCNDDGKHKEYKSKQEKSRKKKLEAEELKSKEDSLQVSAAWEFLGGNVSQLWLLDEEQLIQQAKKKGLSTIGDKDDLIERIMQSQQDEDDSVDNKRGVTSTSQPKQLLLEDGTTSSTKRRRTKASKVDSAVIDLTDSPPSKAVVVKSKTKQKNVDSTTLPSNLHSLSAAQLRSLCISQGLKKHIPPGATKVDLLDILEDNVFE